MFARLAHPLSALAFVALLAAPASAADPPKVEDHGKLFSDLAVKQADEVITDIHKRFHKDVRIEAYNTVPPAKADEFNRNKADKEFRTRFFRAWAAERFSATGTNGVFILIYKESARGYYVQVEPGKETEARREFERDDAQHIEGVIADHLRKGEDDQALTDGVEAIRQAFERNQRHVRPPDEAKPSGRGPAIHIPGQQNPGEQNEGSSIMGWLCPILVVVLIAWVVIGLIRSFTGAGRGYGPYPGGYAGGVGPGGCGYGGGYGGGGG
ncbi:MAG TPA: TPM domain-containing protein, partial [Gemmataceae bacterium]|nr:TPM domain-containing protein [Gemmataceae bacterium]